MRVLASQADAPADERRVIAITGVVTTPRKAQWLDQCALAFDAFACGAAEPEALVLVQIAGCKVRSTWSVHGWGATSSSALLVASEHLRRKAFTDDDETDLGPVDGG